MFTNFNVTCISGQCQRIHRLSLLPFADDHYPIICNADGALDGSQRHQMPLFARTETHFAPAGLPDALCAL
jgi:hypothetical protein